MNPKGLGARPQPRPISWISTYWQKHSTTEDDSPSNPYLTEEAQAPASTGNSPAKPLIYLTGKVPWKWNSIQQLAFDKLKWRVSSEPVLAIPIDNTPYHLETDASDYALGAILSQKQDNKWHPIAFLSKSLNKAGRNYKIYNKEMLAMFLQQLQVI